MTESITVSVIIKTFNEQAGIAKTITSIQSNLAAFSHEIIVADSLSTDKTKAIALQHGAKVVSLVNADERCCGVGHQLGYLHAQGEFLLLMDGDMELEPGFIEQGLEFLQGHAEYAGVAGMVEMDDAQSYEFKVRKARLKQIYPAGDSSHLAGGGLYRKAAIDEIGYLTNRNLHAFEEAELGMRLKRSGYKLHRLDIPYFFHTSYDMSSFELIKYRWRTGYSFAPGELLRGAWGTPHFKDAFKAVKNEAVFTLYLLFLFASLLTFNFVVIAAALLPLVAFFALKVIKNRSLRDGFQSVFNLTIFSAGLIKGLTRRVKNPRQAPENQVFEADR